MKKYILILLLFISCTKRDIEPIGYELVLKEEPTQNRAFDNITYYANQHVTNHGYITYPMNQWSKTVVFTPSCRYECNDPLNQDDWNKLFGVRKNAVEQFKNGAYLVWSYVPYSIIQGDTIIDKIRIGWYLHDQNGNFDPMPLIETIYVDIGVPVYLYLRNFQTYFIYNLNGTVVNINKAQYNILNFSNGWRLSPHSGGDETQDHNMVIQYN
jgi:hypothetical protein